MRKIKGSTNYLKSQVYKNLAIAAFSAFIFAAASALLIYRLLSTSSMGLLNELALIFLIAPLAVLYYYTRQYHIYSGGWAGEKQVVKLLTRKLNNDFFLINDLYLKNSCGDIDQVVLGPNGIFVLETKNWSGNIICNGDQWQRPGKRNHQVNPSKQVRRNISKIQGIIDRNPDLHLLDIKVEGIVVFTNHHASLRLNNPSVSVLKLSQLPYYISSFKRSNSLSGQQLETIVSEIVQKKS
jgi:hypothetical protein